MSRNWKFGNIGNDVTLAVAVEAGEAGDVVPVGDGGLAAYLVTDPATADGPNSPGLQEGYASARLLPCQGVVELEVTGDAGDAVFATVADGAVTYGTTPGGVHIGHIVEPLEQTPTADHAFVFLGTAGTVAVA